MTTIRNINESHFKQTEIGNTNYRILWNRKRRHSYAIQFNL